MAELLFFTTILLPLTGGMIMLVFFRGEDRRWQRIISSVIVALSLSTTLFMIMIHPPPSTFCITWLASAGSMCVTFKQSSLALILLSCLPLLLILSAKKSTVSRAVEFGFLLIAFSMMQVALVSDHFMLRYVALEFVGLCITATALLLTSPNEQRWNNSKQVFINLRIGDLALLVAIFMMFTISDSFDITKNFDDALLGAFDIQMTLTACLLTGVWVKMAIWPLNQWRTATDTVNRSIRIWLLDICAPLLGAYLLYRSAPLLEAQQRTLFPVALAVGYLAVISFVVRDTQQDQWQHTQKSGLQFTSIFLLLAGFWIGQKAVWTFMLLWLFLRAVYLAWLELENRRESSSSRLTAIEAIHFILTHGFCFLLLWLISNQANLPVFESVILWGMWWTHAIFSGKRLSQQLHFLNKDDRRNRPESVAKRILKILLVGMGILAAGVGLTGRATAVVKGEGYSLFIKPMHFRWLPLLNRNFWIGLIAGSLVLFLAQQLMHYKAIFIRIGHRVKSVRRGTEIIREGSSSDPLDFFEDIKLIFQKSAEFVYRHFEIESAEKVGKGLDGVFKFLFRTIEDFSSGNLWKRTLEVVVKSSRNLQQMHHGILRFNMVWLFAFIIGISVFVWVWYMNGWV